LKGKEDHTLEASYDAFQFREKRNSIFSNTGTLLTNPKQLSNIDFTEASSTAQVDYTYPLNETGKIEIGSKYRLRKLKNTYKVDDLIAGNWSSNSNYTNVFNFQEKLLATYATYGQEFGKFGIKTGLRLENTNLITTLENTSQENKQNYIDFFPSVHTSYRFTEKLSLQVSFSRRISRPDMFVLNPFESIRDNFSQFQGNPSLKPEYSNSYELGVIKYYSKGTLNATVYGKTTTNTVEESLLVQNGISITKPLNIGNRNDLGIEFNGTYQATDWLRFTSDFNWFYYKRTGNYNSQDFNFSSNRWIAGITSKFKLPKKLNAEFSLRYRSKQQQLLQTVNENYYVNFGMRKKILNNRMSLNFSVRDIFNTNRYRLVSNQPNIYRSQNTRWGGRQFNLGVSFKLGKADMEEGDMDDYGDDFD
jgi:outer membrane receptor protein involved in Fe transport